MRALALIIGAALTLACAGTAHAQSGMPGQPGGLNSQLPSAPPAEHLVPPSSAKMMPPEPPLPPKDDKSEKPWPPQGPEGRANPPPLPSDIPGYGQ